MFFLNLGLGEFFALASAFGGALVALYLLDRSRRKQVVATLRFFPAAANPPRRAHRRHLQQPWSLLLQILSVLLLLLALGQLRFGGARRTVRDHVLLVDTSAWMGARGGSGRLIEAARAAARRYIRALPAGDRVMVVRASAAPSPAGPFTSDRQALVEEIDASQPGAAALDIEQALEFAREARRVAGDEPGEIAFAGAGRVNGAAALPGPRGLRMLGAGAGPKDNRGLRELTVRRSEADPEAWEIFVSAHNYGDAAAPGTLTLWFDGAAIGVRSFVLGARSDHDETFLYRTRAAGRLDARLTPGDAFPPDNAAELRLPAQPLLPVMVYSSQPAALEAIFATAPGVAATFVPPSRYPVRASPGGLAPIVVFDGFGPAREPEENSIWIDPPAARSPVMVGRGADHVTLTGWNAEHPLGKGLRATGFEIANALVFVPGPEDTAVASSSAGPVIVARAGARKTVVFGFDPAESAMKYELATPVLFANILHWMAPEVFRRQEFSARPAGAVSVTLDAVAPPGSVRVVGADGSDLPFTCDGASLRFFTADAGIVRVSSGDRERVFSLTLPSPGEAVWHPAGARTGFPPASGPDSPQRDVWPCLALAGGAGLLADWLLYGTGRGRTRPRGAAAEAPRWRRAS